eukprot:gene6500-8935_t
MILKIVLLFIFNVFIIGVSASANSAGSITKKFNGDDNVNYGNKYGNENDRKDIGSSSVSDREQLYEAYNLLHTLAQDFHKPFDAPAVIVVGHQTSGKSALIEALMGFQFNQVGGGTKTRRPVALRMQYNPSCTTPLCFLTLENGKEQQKSLSDIQSYIEAENKRLEKDPSRSFDPREINIRMEYKYCPNMIVIDTPGMIHPPKGRQLTPQQRALAQASREAENLVLSKIRCQDYIILCVEDTTDWKHATTRNVVMQADPQLTRTVLVTTKLDTKLPQFSEAEDLEDFLRASLVKDLYSQMLGGPFYTSVPSGRVGLSKALDSTEAFVHSLLLAEKSDRTHILSKIGTGKVRQTAIMNSVGVSRLRAFLEKRVEDTYRRNVAKIVPLLQSDLKYAEAKLFETEAELESLSIEKLKLSANLYRERFAKELSLAIQGTVKANPDEWGETLEAEQIAGGSFIADNMQTEKWQRILENEVGNNHHKLFGGAQYHRAIREFTIAVRHMKIPSVTEDEIANAAGMGDTHNGVNFMRAACVIAMEKAQQSFDPILESLRHRAVHIMKRLFPIVEHMVRKSANSAHLDTYNGPFTEMIRRIYEKFIDQQINDCLQKCRDDLNGMTRFVTWDIEDKGGSSTLYRLLPTPKKMVEIYSIAVDNSNKRRLKDQRETYDDEEEDSPSFNAKKNTIPSSKNDKQTSNSGTAADKILAEWNQANTGKSSIKANKNQHHLSSNNVLVKANGAKPSSNMPSSLTTASSPYEDDPEMNDYFKVMQLTEEMLSGSNQSRTSGLITSLVQYII